MIPQKQRCYNCRQQTISFHSAIVICGLAVYLFAVPISICPASSQNAAPAAISMRSLLTIKAPPSNVNYSPCLTSVAFSPDGLRILTGSHDKRVIVWNAQNGREILSLPGLKNSIYSVAFSPDGKRIATGDLDYAGHCSTIVWDAATGQEIRKFNGHTTSINAVAFSPDGKQLLTANSTLFEFIQNVREDNTASLWDVDTGREMMVLKAHHYDMKSAVFSGDGRHVLTSSLDCTARVWDVETGKLILTIAPEGIFNFIYSAAFSPDGNFVVTVGGQHQKSGEVNFWDASRSVAEKSARASVASGNWR